MFGSRWFTVRRVLFLLGILIGAGLFWAPNALHSQEKGESTSAPGVALPRDMEKTALDQAAREAEQLQARVRPLFQRQSLGFDAHTIRRVRTWAMELPSRAPLLLSRLEDQGHALGWTAPVALFGFLLAALFCILGQKRIRLHSDRLTEPLANRISPALTPYVGAVLRILSRSIAPLLLFGLYSLILAFIPHASPGLQVPRQILWLWVVGAVAIHFLREVLTRDLLPVEKRYGVTAFRLARVMVLYVLIGMAIFGALRALAIPQDVMALVRFLFSISVVVVVFPFLLKKRSILGVLPSLPYPGYRFFLTALERLYFPLMALTLAAGFLWCFGYQPLAAAIWTKTWAVVGCFVGIMLVFHAIQGWTGKWMEGKGEGDEHARSVFRALRSLTLYSTVAAVTLVTVWLMGLLEPLRGVLSFPIAEIGESRLSLWTFMKAAVTLVAFVLLSRLLRSWLDYKIYPRMGVDEGLAYAINTFLKYLLLALALLFALRVVGIDLRVLMVFAGAAGIGIGLGLQNMAANLFSSFTLVFGRRIKKGDWIQVGDKLGAVREVGLAATRVWTRDNIEYLIPNSDLTSNTIVNYSLSDPLIRVHVPVGVSYSSDLKAVTRILIQAGSENPRVSKQRKVHVWFTEYGDNSLNFELLVWMDVRKVSEKQLRSELYFAIFRAFAQAGIEIPFPQRDIHIRSGLPGPPGTGT